MPADSDSSAPHTGRPSLPRTWRPLGVRLAVVFFGSMLFIVCAAAWLGFDPSVRERFTFLQRATVVLFGLSIAAVGWVLGRARVTATADRLVVVNGLRRRELAWEQVVAVRFTSGAPWATLDLTDGTTLAVMALQSSDGNRARDAVRELRALVDG